MYAHLVGSRSTAVGLYGIAIVPLSYLSFCGWLPLVSITRTLLPAVTSFRALLALGVLVAWVTSSSGSDFGTGLAAQLSLAYWSVSVFLNTTLTCMICYRVVRHGRKVQSVLGNEYASLYFAVVTTIVESVLPYTLSGIAFLVTFGVGSPTSAAFICVYFLMMVRSFATFPAGVLAKLSATYRSAYHRKY
jgi:hypothetical protein